MATEDLTHVLDDAGARYELLPHPETMSAVAEAEALGVDPADVGKTLVVTTPQGNLRAVVPGNCRLDMHKLRDLLGSGGKRVHLLTEDDLAHEYPEFELGAVPPLGGARSDRVLVDSRIAERESVVVEAGSHERSVRVATDELIRLSRAQVADICED